MSSSSGPLWSLYPLLGIIAFCEFCCGVVHLTLCLPLYFLVFPILNGVLGLLASFHAIFLRYPNRCDFVLQFICSVCAFWFFSSSLVETYCLGDFESNEENIQEGICHGLKYRTISLVGSCSDFLGPMQLSLLAKIGWEPKDRDSISFFISCSLSILSCCHLICATALTFYSAVETKMRFYSYHYQIVIGIMIIFAGLIHLRYCCTFFFLALPLAIGVYSVIQGIVSWRTRCHGSVSRAMNVTGSALALLLFAATAFGIFCWFHRRDIPHALTRHCHWLPKTEEYCIRVIHFSNPYINWTEPETEREIAVVQMTVYCFLLVFSFLQFAFSMKSAFSTKDIELYF